MDIFQEGFAIVCVCGGCPSYTGKTPEEMANAALKRRNSLELSGHARGEMEFDCCKNSFPATR